jgi:hypothetical protein
MSFERTTQAVGKEVDVFFNDGEIRDECPAAVLLIR